jgi:hypothetical protein
MWDRMLGAFTLATLLWPDRFHLCTTRQENIVLCWRANRGEPWRVLLHLAREASGRRPPEHIMIAFNGRRRCDEGITCEPLDRLVADSVRSVAGGQYFATNAPGVMEVVARVMAWALTNSGNFAPQ